MILLNINVFLLKTVTCFYQLVYSLISTVRCEADAQDALKASFLFFASKPQLYQKSKTLSFLKTFSGEEVQLTTELKFETINLVDGNDSKIIKKWKKLQSENFIRYYNEEIENLIVSNLTKDGDKIQIKIKVDQRVKEFIFWEFKVSGDYIEYTNCNFPTEKKCYLDFFPKEVYPVGYLLHYIYFCTLFVENSFKNSNTNNIKKHENIKSLTVKTSSNCALLFDMENFKKPNEFKFSDFNLSIKQSERFEEVEKTSNKEVYQKQLKMLFETTKIIPEISLDVFFPLKDTDEKQLGSLKYVVEIPKDGKVTTKVEFVSFKLMEIQKTENSLKIILGRHTGEVKNHIISKYNLSIEFMNFLCDTKSTKINLIADAKNEGDFTFTTFTVKKGKNKGKESKLYDAIVENGLVSITLNGENGIIGTYSIFTRGSEISNCVYINKLLSIPFGVKTGFFTKKVIIVGVIVVLSICGGIFAYFYTRKKEESFDTF